MIDYELGSSPPRNNNSRLPAPFECCNQLTTKNQKRCLSCYSSRVWDYGPTSPCAKTLCLTAAYVTYIAGNNSSQLSAPRFAQLLQIKSIGVRPNAKISAIVRRPKTTSSQGHPIFRETPRDGSAFLCVFCLVLVNQYLGEGTRAAGQPEHAGNNTKTQTRKAHKSR